MYPILFRFGPVAIYSFGFFLCLGFLLACFVVWKQARSNGLSEEKVLDGLFLTVFSSLLAGRLGYVAAFWPQFSVDYSRIVLFFKYPGLSFPVLLIVAILFCALTAKKFGLEVLWQWDIFAFAAAFFAVFGSFGCFLDGCYPPAPMLPLMMSVLAVLLVVFFVFLEKKFSSSAQLAEISKQRGIFLLWYLIFQLVSLLMTTWFTKNWWREAVYGLGLLGILVIFVVRYRLLFKYVYSAISQRRSRTN